MSLSTIHPKKPKLPEAPRRPTGFLSTPPGRPAEHWLVKKGFPSWICDLKYSGWMWIILDNIIPKFINQPWILNCIYLYSHISSWFKPLFNHYNHQPTGVDRNSNVARVTLPAPGAPPRDFGRLVHRQRLEAINQQSAVQAQLISDLRVFFRSWAGILKGTHTQFPNVFYFYFLDLNFGIRTLDNTNNHIQSHVQKTWRAGGSDVCNKNILTQEGNMFCCC